VQDRESKTPSDGKSFYAGEVPYISVSGQGKKHQANVHKVKMLIDPSSCRRHFTGKLPSRCTKQKKIKMEKQEALERGTRV